MQLREPNHIFPEYTKEEYETAGEAFRKIRRADFSEVELKTISKANEKRERVNQRNLRRKKGNI